MADTNLVIAQIIADFGEYFQNNGQNEASIRHKIYYGFETAGSLTPIPTNDTIIRMAETEVEEVIQPYQDDFTPKGGLTVKPFQLILQQLKVDQKFNPNKLMNSWLGFLTSNSTDRTTWPFIKWFIEIYLVKKIQEDLEMSIIYTGEYAAPVAGTAGAASTSMDGIRKVLNDAITAGDITTIATGAFAADEADFVTQIEEFIDGIDEKYWHLGLELNMSHANVKKYRRGMRKKYNIHYEAVEDLSTVTDTNVKVLGRFSHKASDKIWMTPKENAILGLKGAENQGTFEIEKVDRSVKIYTDFWMGVGFIQPSLVFTNDQDLV
jgi:hypothetical protein